MNIGSTIKGEKIKKNLTPEFVADKIKVDISTYRKYERDEVSPNMNTIEKIADALEVPIFSLIPNAFTQNNDNQSGGVAILYNHSLQLSEKAIEICEVQIAELKADKEYLKTENQELKSTIEQLRMEIKKFP